MTFSEWHLLFAFLAGLGAGAASGSWWAGTRDVTARAFALGYLLVTAIVLLFVDPFLEFPFGLAALIGFTGSATDVFRR